MANKCAYGKVQSGGRCVYPRMNLLDLITGWFLIVGGLVHLLQGFGFYFVNFIANLFNALWLGKAIYIVVGLSAIYFIYRISVMFR